MTDRSLGATRPLLLGLIGSPIRHSASPAMHEAMADSVARRCHYQLIDIAAADRTKLRAMLDGVRWLGFAGVNITYPYKEAVVPLLDALGPDVAEIGAVNTVVVRNDELVGYNTDATGFARAFREVIGNAVGRPVALIGAGGVGRAIGFALAGLGVPILRIFDRDGAKAAALAADLGARAVVVVCHDVESALDGVEGLVNATPVGMLPDRSSPVSAKLLHARLWVADAIYTPLWTPLLLAARACGARVMTGRELAIYQGADAFGLFSGSTPSVAPAAAAFDAVMSERDAKAGAD